MQLSIALLKLIAQKVDDAAKTSTEQSRQGRLIVARYGR